MAGVGGDFAEVLRSKVHNVSREARRAVLRGLFTQYSDRIWKVPTWKLLVFSSSTFTDTGLERDFLMDTLLFELREIARPFGIQVIIVDMRWGVRDENSQDHKTWIECANALNWCKRESMGIFFLSLQSEKYGYTPLLKSILQSDLEAHLAAASAATCPDDLKQLIFEWYCLDTNAVPAEYVLKNLVNHNDPAFWTAFGKMLPVLQGVRFDTSRYLDLTVGRSVTNWEVQAAFDVYPEDVERDSLSSYCWSHRELVGDIVDRLYSDTKGSPVLERYFQELLAYMKKEMPSAAVQEYSKELSLTDLLAAAADNNAKKTAYMAQFRIFVSTRLKASLDSIIALRQQWEIDGCDVGVSGPELSEMLHHAHWACVKCHTFQNREALVECALRLIKAPHRIVKKSAPVILHPDNNCDGCGMFPIRGLRFHCTVRIDHDLCLECREKDASGYPMEEMAGEVSEIISTSESYAGISLCLVGVSGAGKTGLMTKLAKELTSHRNELLSAGPTTVPVITRFCGTSAGSCSAAKLIASMCAQIEYVYELESPLRAYKKTSTNGSKSSNSSSSGTTTSSPSYASSVEYFQRLLAEYPVILFIDSLDQLSDEDQGRSQISFLRGLHPHPETRVIVSCLPDEYEIIVDLTATRKKKKKKWKYLYLCDTVMAEAKVPRLEVILSTSQNNNNNPGGDGLHDAFLSGRSGGAVVNDKDSEVQKLLRSIVTRMGRSLTPLQWVHVDQQVRVEPTALYVNLAARIVVEWTSSTSPHLEAGVRPLLLQIFGSLERNFGETLVRASLALITYATDGVSDVEMEDLLSLNEKVLDFVFQYATPNIRRIPSHVWLRLKGALGDFLVEREGSCLVWYHRQLKETAEAYLDGEKQQCHAILAMYFGNLVTPELLKARKLTKQDWTICGEGVFDVKALVNVRRCREASFHMLAAQQWEAAERELCCFEGICAKLRIGANEGFEAVAQLLSLYRAKSQPRVYHYLLWLQKTVQTLSLRPIEGLFFSATAQPKISFVRLEAIELLRQINMNPSSHYSTFVRGMTVGSKPDFDTLMTKCVGHTNWVCAVAFHADGRTVVSSSSDKTIRLWNIDTGSTVRTMHGHNLWITCVDISPDGSTIASGSKDYTIRLWDVDTGANEMTLEGHKHWVRVVRFCHSGTMLASGSKDKSVRIWFVETDEPERVLMGHEGSVNALFFSRDDEKLVTAGHDKTIRVWSTISWEVERKLVGHSSPIYALGWATTLTTFLSGGEDTSIFVWDLANGGTTRESVMDGHTSRVRALLLLDHAARGTLAISASEDKTIRVWSLATLTTDAILSSHENSVTSLAMCPQQLVLASGSMDKTVCLWKWEDAARDQTEANPEPVHHVAFSSDGTRLASCGQEPCIRVWSVATGEMEMELIGHAKAVNALAFSKIDSSSALLVSASDDETVRLWDTTLGGTGVMLATLDNCGEAALCVAFDHNSDNEEGSLIAAGSSEGIVRVWIAGSRCLLATLEKHDEWTNAVLFTLDGTKVISASDDKTVRVWSLASGMVEAVLRVHSRGVTCLALSPDGRRVASGSDDTTVRVWTLLSLLELSRDRTVGNNGVGGDGSDGGGEGDELEATTIVLKGHSKGIKSVSFSPDGGRLVSASWDSTMKVWELAAPSCPKPHRTLEGHRNWVMSCAFSPPDGNRVASCSLDCSVRLWDVGWFNPPS